MRRGNQFKYDETKLRPGQREAAILLAENDFTPFDERKTRQEIADEIGYSRMSLYKWEKRDANFIAYKNSLSSNIMDGHLSLTYSKLIDVIKDGNTKGIELFLKRIGDLDNRSEITLNEGSGDNLSFEERQAALLARIAEETEEADNATSNDVQRSYE